MKELAEVATLAVVTNGFDRVQSAVWPSPA